MAMIPAAAPRSGWFHEGRIHQGSFSLFWHVYFLQGVFAFPRHVRLPWRPGPFFRAPCCSRLAACRVPALVSGDTVDRSPWYPSTRHWIWTPFPGDPPTPCPWLCKGGRDAMGFLGVAKPHHRDGYQCPEYSIYHPSGRRKGGRWRTRVLRGRNPLRRNATVPCRR